MWMSMWMWMWSVGVEVEVESKPRSKEAKVGGQGRERSPAQCSVLSAQCPVVAGAFRHTRSNGGRVSGWGDGGEAAGQDGSGLGEDREGGPGQGKQSRAGGTAEVVSSSSRIQNPGSRCGGCGQRKQTRTRTQTQKGQKRTIVPNLPARLVSSRLGWPAATISGRCRHRCSRCIACPGPSRNKSPLAIPRAAHYWRQRFGAIQQKPPVQHDPWPLRMAPKQERRSRAARAAAAAIPRGTHPCSVAGSGSSWSATGSWTASPPAGPGSAARRRQLALGCLQQLMAGLSLSLRCPVLRFGSGDPPPFLPVFAGPQKLEGRRAETTNNGRES